MGRESVQLIIRDIKPSTAQRYIYDKNKERFEQIKAGAPFSAEEQVMPARDDFAAVYNLMRSSLRIGVNTLTHKEIISRLAFSSPDKHIGYIKLKFIIMVLKELNLVALEEVEEEVYSFRISYSTAKTELDRSSWLRRLRSQLARNG